jgi:hypothetical protein
MADKLRSFGVKVIIVDVPRPQLSVWMPDVGPGDPLPPQHVICD